MSTYDKRVALILAVSFVSVFLLGGVAGYYHGQADQIAAACKLIGGVPSQ